MKFWKNLAQDASCNPFSSSLGLTKSANIYKPNQTKNSQQSKERNYLKVMQMRISFFIFSFLLAAATLSTTRAVISREKGAKKYGPVRTLFLSSSFASCRKHNSP